MRIKEVAELTGLTISNIRFYEKKGLISPEREKQSQYRDYTKEDVRRLKLIVLYRKMDLSIETIGELVGGGLSVDEALTRQLAKLREELSRLQGSIDLCERLAGDLSHSAASVVGACGEDAFDVDWYLSYVKREEATGHPFAQVQELLEDFAEFSQYDRVMLSSGLYFWLSQHPYINRVLAAAWCIFWLVFPVLVLADDLLSEGSVSAGSVVFWGAWLLFTGWTFVQFWSARRRKRN